VPVERGVARESEPVAGSAAANLEGKEGREGTSIDAVADLHHQRHGTRRRETRKQQSGEFGLLGRLFG